LNADDFASDQLRAVEALKGYSPIFHRYGKGGRTLLEEQTNREPFVFAKNDEKKDRIDHEIVNAATRKNECEGAADKNWQQSSHDSLANYAADQGLDFYDFNTKELYHEIGYDFANDNGDSMHPNLAGADKLTDYMGELLLTCYHVPAYRDDQWSTTRTYVDAINQSAVLTK
jgi:lysophospholipase L1-like esterase